jgi:hypothetical protein
VSWTEPIYTRSEVRHEGEWLRTLDIPVNSEIIKNWRSAHSWPLHHFYVSLRSRARKVNRNSLVSQRLKRLSSIHAKLRREPHMKLNTMQDIAGCRAIMGTVEELNDLLNVYKAREFQHKFDYEKDYVSHPKASGYRSHHLIYKYSSATAAAYNDMRVEIQCRTALQHAWATALETVDLFTKQALKSSHGQAEWERFFVLISCAFAAKEHTAPVPGVPEGRELLQEICHLKESLQVTSKLKSYKSYAEVLGLKQVQQQRPDTVLLQIQIGENEASTILITGFRADEAPEALAAYYQAETQGNSDAVLVSTARTRNLKRAFPNYFADTDVFIREVDAIVSAPNGTAAKHVKSSAAHAATAL